MLRDHTVLDLAWRSGLVAAAAAMVGGGVLHAAGRQELSASVVTVAFALAMLAVLAGLATRPEPTEEEL